MKPLKTFLGVMSGLALATTVFANSKDDDDDRDQFVSVHKHGFDDQHYASGQRRQCLPRNSAAKQ